MTLHAAMVLDLPALIKHVGKGSRLAKDLSRADAAAVMSELVAGRAHPVQVGGFLMAMRMKSEAPEELAGFVDALRAAAVPLELGADATRPLVDVDLHGDGRHGRPVVSLAAACLAAAAGARVLVRGVFGHRFARHDLGAVFARLGLPPSGPGALASARLALAGPGVAVVDLADYLPGAAELLALRELLGVRTCVNTAVKLVDPARSGRVALGIFHGPYHAPVAGAARLLGATRAAVVQAAGGVPELAPDKPTRVSLVDAAAPTFAARGAGPDEPLAFSPLPGPGAVAPPVVDGADALAELLDAVVHRPTGAPPGAVRMTVATAALHLWLAGLAPSPSDPATVARLHDQLCAGSAGEVLRGARSCYTQ